MITSKLTKQLLHTTDNYIKSLNKANIISVWDLLNHYPRSYEDRTNVLDDFSLINIKEKNTILVKLISLDTKRTKNWKILTKWVLEDKNWFYSEVVWFNRKYLASQLSAFKQKQILVSGKVKYDYWKVSFSSPEVQTDLSKVVWEIVPVYQELNYVPSKWILSKMKLLESYIQYIERFTRIYNK